MLVENTLYGEVDKVLLAVRRLQREYRNRNDRRRMMKKTWELIKQRNGVW